VVQQEMWDKHHITDAFVAIYDFDTNERVAFIIQYRQIRDIERRSKPSIFRLNFYLG